MSVAASLKTSPPGGAPDGDLPEGACSENEVRVPPPGPGSAPRSAAGAPNPTPPRLLCSTSDPSSGDECTPSHTAFLLFLEFGLRRNTDHPGLDRADLRSAATTVPAAQDGATPGPSLPGEAARYPSPCAGGLATNLQGAADPPMPRRPRGRSSLPGTPRTRQGGARRTGGRTRQPRPRPRPRRCVPTARTTPPPALLTRPFNLPTGRPRVRRLQGTRPRPLQNEVSWEALRSLPRGPGSWREGRLLSPLLATRLAGHPVPRVSAPEFPIDVTSPPHTHAHACTHACTHRHTHRHTRTHT